MIRNRSLLLVVILSLVLLALMVTPRPKENSRQFAEAYADYRQMREVSSWSR